MVKAGEELVHTEVQFIPAGLKAIGHYRELMSADPAGNREHPIWKSTGSLSAGFTLPCICIRNGMADLSEV